MAWTIRFADTARKQLAKLDPQTARRITKFLRIRLGACDDPRSLGHALKGEELGEYWRYRVGDYRILCDIRDSELVILTLAIGHRREIYRE
ncbi:MAG TPA: type II toxin-antitoxin system RelE/ParE family toxin [Terracidiphilus sp.]|nr:type II toxin-antitoxin system RelE/ParE family toxin [Terracidiphilus sp.]